MLLSAGLMELKMQQQQLKKRRKRILEEVVYARDVSFDCDDGDGFVASTDCLQRLVCSVDGVLLLLIVKDDALRLIELAS